jgi:NADH-quinone oxidoreductase subunit G
MASSADIDDLTVITPAGERSSFSVEIDALHQHGQSKMVIRRLARKIL